VSLADSVLLADNRSAGQRGLVIPCRWPVRIGDTLPLADVVIQQV
jgi:hypothetical protein